MDQTPERGDPGKTMIDDWVQTALSDALLRIVDNDWLDICEVDRVARALDQARSANRLPSRDEKSEPQYAGLVALHCVNYREMNRTTLAGVPDALLTVFGLNDRSGPLFLGTERWSQVRSRFQRQKFSHSAQNAIASMPDQQEGVKPDSRVAGIKTLLRLAKVRTNAGSAVQAVGMLLNDALAWTRAAWEQPTTIWARIVKPAQPDPFFPPRSSPSHPPCHQFRDDVAPSCAPIPDARAPCAFPDLSDVGDQRAHAAAGARTVDPRPARERRLVPRGDQWSGLGQRRARHAGRADKAHCPYHVRRDSKSQNK